MRKNPNMVEPQLKNIYDDFQLLFISPTELKR